LAIFQWVYFGKDTAAELLESPVPGGLEAGGPKQSLQQQQSGGPSPMKPRSLQPPHTAGRSRQSPTKPLHPDESENMNPDEVRSGYFAFFISALVSGSGNFGTFFNIILFLFT
jgi:hypothetical protein